jgi:predicted ATPase
MTACSCDTQHPTRLVVLTGGPGAGKTAVLEVMRRQVCSHVVILPEAASILWNGGFPRRQSLPARCSAQRAIAKLQMEMQRMVLEEGRSSLIVCDRGTLDGLAYWPGEPAAYFEELNTTREQELARYAAVIQLRPPTAQQGYRTEAPRIETAAEAAAIDERITAAWAGHPRHFVVDSSDDFFVKLQRTTEIIRAEIPACCRARLAA